MIRIQAKSTSIEAKNQPLRVQPQQTLIMSKSDQQSKKRKRLPPVDQFVAEQQDRHDKLMHACTKSLHKEAKVVKAFECQKIVRKMKETKGKEKLDSKLVQVKACCLDHVVKLAQQRLGLFNLNPKGEPIEPPVEIPASERELVERMLQHKRISSAIDHWNEKVTEYRRWCLRRQEHVHGEPDFGYEVKKVASRKGTKKKLSTPKSADSSGLFVTLDGAVEAEEDDADDDDNRNGNWYGPGGNEDLVVVKQNRMGQRARRAKALAKQAKKEGKTWSKSINWRPKKDLVDEGEQQQPQIPNTTKPSSTSAPRIAEMGKVWKEEGQAHPSWAARASEKTGIVAFAGKRITFD